jgi:acyl transferase domain-containing protein
VNEQRQTRSVAKLALAAKHAYDAGGDVAADPIAVVGMGCRFPAGAKSAGEFWRRLVDGVDAIEEIPRARWDAEAYFDPDPAHPGTMNTRWGSFLEDIDRFDAAVFGISAREAAAMDPQHRLVLEVAYEALEDAGQTHESLRGSRTGVFFALYNTDYLQGLHANRASITAYATAGTVPSMAAGRVSYHFDLRGPSLVVDTACSSSLVGVHLACESLRVRSSDLAVAGGVSLILSPDRTISLTKWNFMSPDGRCRPFDARANGWVRGEGCGVVVLKRLADALAAGDRVLAVVRGSAIVQDGRSAVLTAPNGAAQVAVIRAALENGRVSPNDVEYVEAHGTGTLVGDPVEFEALDEALGRAPSGAPCHVGALKANVGHLEAAAGIAGFIKVVQILRNGFIPPQLHFERLNPLLSFEGSRLRIAPAGAAWPRGERRRFAGVSAFGFSGTNAHVVLEEAPSVPRQSRVGAPGVPLELLVSANSPTSLRGIAERYCESLERDDELRAVPLVDTCFTAGRKRHHYRHRLAVTGATTDEIVAGLRSFLGGEPTWRVAHGCAGVTPVPGPVFVFSGQGSQWAGMGRTLLDSEPAAREAFAECAALVHGGGGPALFDELSRTGEESRLSSTAVAQPTIFALQIALAAQLREWGVVPAAVVGHSIGEVAAAYVAGALTLQDAVHVVLARSGAMEPAADRGRMLAARLTEEDATALLSAFSGRLSLAAVNAADAVVLSGAPEVVEAVHGGLERRGVRSTVLDVRYAFHSYQMSAACGGLADALGAIAPCEGQVPFVSTVTGAVLGGAALDGQYWERNAVSTVRFRDAIRTVVAAGHRHFLELGPHPVLGNYVTSMLAGVEDATVVPTLHRNRDDRASLMSSVGALHARGCAVELKRFIPRGEVVSLPQYAWDRQRYWAPEFDAAQGLARGDSHVPAPSEAPLVLREVVTPWTDRRVFETTVNAAQPAYVADHRICGQLLFPAAGFLTLIASVAERLFTEAADIADVFLHAPLALGDGDVILQIGVERATGDDATSFDVVSRPADSAQWVKHVSGQLRPPRSTKDHVDGGTDASDAQLAPASPTTLYERLLSLGIEFGQAFRTVESIKVAEGAAVARVRLAGDRRAGPGDWIHPTVLDGCLHAAMAIPSVAASTGALVPIAFERVRHFRKGVQAVTARVAVLRGTDDRTWNADILVADEQGAPVTIIERATLAPYVPSCERRQAALDESLHVVEWQRLDRLAPDEGRSRSYLILADEGGLAARLAARLRSAGLQCSLISATDEGVEGAVRAQPLDAEALRRAVSAFVAAAPAPREILHLWSLDVEPSTSDDERGLESALERTCASALHMMQAIAGMPGAFETVTFVTRAAHATTPLEATHPIQALVWGMARAIDHEFPEIRCRRIDLPLICEAEQAVVADAVTQASQRELAWRGQWLTPRVRPVSMTAPAELPRTLEIGTPGLLDTLRLRVREPEQPGAGEVLIRVRASGLNFRDVLTALDMYPGGGSMGSECVGQVEAVGEGVHHVQPGDQVVALSSRGFATFVTATAALTLPLPHGLDPLDAATIPIAYLTAAYGLMRIAQLQRGQRVLVHAGAGGVGLAAIQLALRHGAEVYATAGSEIKRTYLRAMGVRVADSRDVEFGAAVLAASAGHRMDVVVNALSGEFIPRTLDLLAPGGCFIEIGRRGIWDAPAVHARRADVRYVVFYLGDEIQRDPAAVAGMLQEVLERVGHGELPPLPRRAFPLDAAAAAFRFMAQARHIGKILLTSSDDRVHKALRADAAYLITGGLGALGLHAAHWLIERGARHVVLASRSSAPEGSELERLRTLATVEHVRCDVTSRADVDGLIAQFGTRVPALRGVVHAAASLHDGMLVTQSWRDFRLGLDAKIAGAWHLHRATERLPLDFFVCYSSIAAVLGSKGQGAYSAANAFLDALAASRQAEGLPSVSIGWGALQRGGMLSRVSSADRARWTADGIVPLTDGEAWAALDHAVLNGRDAPHVLPALVRWGVYASRHPFRASLLELTRPESGEPQGDQTPSRAATEPLRKGVDRLPLEERREFLRRHVRGRVLTLVGLPADHQMDDQMGFRELGLDSLLAVELRNALQADLRLPLPATLAFDYPTVSTLAGFLFDQLGYSLSAPVGPELAAAAAANSAELDMMALSDAEAVALLEKELEALASESMRGN